MAKDYVEGPLGTFGLFWGKERVRLGPGDEIIYDPSLRTVAFRRGSYRVELTIGYDQYNPRVFPSLSCHDLEDFLNIVCIATGLQVRVREDGLSPGGKVFVLVDA